MNHGNITTEILTLEEARRRLPHVRPLVVALMETASEVVDLDNTLEDLDQRGCPDADRERLAGRARELAARCDRTMRAINDLGATIKDPMTGLLDFYAWKDDDLVFLCWKYGEDTIRWWHGLDAGFRGRRPVET
jgi:hypothetical protein